MILGAGFKKSLCPKQHVTLFGKSLWHVLQRYCAFKIYINLEYKDPLAYFTRFYFISPSKQA